MGFGERKKVFFEIDARWNIRIAFRMLMNVLCIMSIVMAVITIKKSETTKFRPKPFTQANTVLVYIPCDAITIVWNMFNIMLFIVKKKNVAHWLNTLAHFILGFGFAVVGVYVTVVAWGGYKGISGDLYDVGKRGTYTTTAVNGSSIEVNADNTDDCPAFSSCQSQAYWVTGAKSRSLISVIGCCLFDAVFLLHVAFFFWCMNDSVFGFRGRKQRQLDKDERARIKQDALDNPVPRTVDSEKPFDLSSKPSISIDEKYNSEFSFGGSNSSDIEMIPRRHTTMPEALSRESIVFESTTPRYPSLPPKLVLRPTEGSRDSLSLSIFDTTHSVPPQNPRSSLQSSLCAPSKRMSRSFTAPLAGQGVPRSSVMDADAITTSTHDHFLEQQQLQQLQHQITHQSPSSSSHKHTSGCTCSQSRASYSSVSTHYQQRTNRQSTDAAHQRQSLHNTAAAPSMKSTANRTSSVFSGVSSHSTNSSSSNFAPLYPMPPVPPIPQSFTSRQSLPTARSSLRHSISPAEILDTPSSPVISPQPTASARRSLHNQMQQQQQQQQQPPHRSSLVSSQHKYQLPPLQIQSYSQSQSQSQSQSHQQQPQQYQESSNYFDSLLPMPQMDASAIVKAKRKSIRMHQALPDVLSPIEKDVTALPKPPAPPLPTIMPLSGKRAASRKSGLRMEL